MSISLLMIHCQICQIKLPEGNRHEGGVDPTKKETNSVPNGFRLQATSYVTKETSSNVCSLSGTGTTRLQCQRQTSCFINHLAMSQVSNILLKNLGISGMPSSRLRNMFCVKTIGLWETKEKLWSLYLPNGETRLANFGVSNPFW
jgi:hypothetical protein